jgi:curved DNA-binding protein CbpA
VLGVKLNATPEDIERAYQDLAALFEVDHVEAMGDATVSAANSGFSKIQQAYRRLLAKS